MVEILPNSPAEKAGLRPLDIIVRVDNEPVESMVNLRKTLYKYRIGDKATLTVIRNGKEFKTPITFTEIK